MSFSLSAYHFTSRRIDGQNTFLELDVSILVSVNALKSEDMFTELLGFNSRKT